MNNVLEFKRKGQNQAEVSKTIRPNHFQENRPSLVKNIALNVVVITVSWVLVNLIMKLF